MRTNLFPLLAALSLAASAAAGPSVAQTSGAPEQAWRSLKNELETVGRGSPDAATYRLEGAPCESRLTQVRSGGPQTTVTIRWSALDSVEGKDSAIYSTFGLVDFSGPESFSIRVGGDGQAARIARLANALKAACSQPAPVPAPGSSISAGGAVADTATLLRTLKQQVEGVRIRGEDGAVQSYRLTGAPCAPVLTQTWSNGSPGDPHPLRLVGASVKGVSDYPYYTVEIEAPGAGRFGFSVDGAARMEGVVGAMRALAGACARPPQQPRPATTPAAPSPQQGADTPRAAFQRLKAELETSGDTHGLSAQGLTWLSAFKLTGTECRSTLAVQLMRGGQVMSSIDYPLTWSEVPAPAIEQGRPSTVVIDAGEGSMARLDLGSPQRAQRVLDLANGLRSRCRGR